MKLKSYEFHIAVIIIIFVGVLNGESAITVSNDPVPSERLAALICTVINTNLPAETVRSKSWQDSDRNEILDGKDDYTITELGGDQLVHWKITRRSLISDTTLTCIVELSSGVVLEAVGIIPTGTSIIKRVYQFGKGAPQIPSLSMGVLGGSVLITCLAFTDDDVKSIHWKLNDNPVRDSPLYEITHTFSTIDSSKHLSSVIEINPLDAQHDESSVVCSVVSGDNWFTSNHGVLKVLSISGPPMETAAFRGVPVSMYCTVRGNLKPIIEWHKNDEELSDVSSTQSYLFDFDRYTSVLSFPNTSSAAEGKYKCKATWLTDGGINGGTAKSDEVELHVYEEDTVLFITPDTQIEKNTPLSLKCTIESFRKSAIVWKRDGIDFVGNSYTVQKSESSRTSILTVSTSTTGSNVYTCASKYISDEGEVSYSAYQSVTLTVYQICSALSNPTGGILVCDGSKSDRICSIACSSGYIGQDSPKIFACVDGSWYGTPSIGECTAIKSPSSYTISHRAVYNSSIPCKQSWGPYILAAYPYYLATATKSISHFPATVLIDSDSFECSNYPENCSSATSCEKINIKFSYTQTTSLENDKPLKTVLKEVDTYIENNGFDVLDILNSNHRIDSAGNLVGSSGGKAKRSAADFDGQTVYMDPVSVEDVQESIECPEFTIKMHGFCTLCGDGWFVQDTTCAPCPIGTYQEEAYKCKPCPAGLSTLTTAATSHLMCTAVCGVTKPLHGSVYPPEDTLLTVSSNVTVMCDRGFVLSNGEQQGILPCLEEVECSRIMLYDIPEYVIRDTTLTMSCVIETAIEFSSCHLIKGNVVIDTEEVERDNDRQICKFSDVYVTETAIYSCTAVKDRVQLESPKNKITLLTPIVTPDQVILQTFNTLNLACTAVAPAGYSMTMLWKKYGKVVSSRSFFDSPLGLIMYTIDSARFEDSGEYTCEVKYMGVGFSESKAVSVKILGFLEGLSDFTLYQGQSVLVLCASPFAGSITLFEWYKDDVRILDTVSEVRGYSTQIIQSNFTIKESGTYQCRIESEGTMLISEAEVYSNANHGFLTHPESQYTTAGSPISFYCKFSDSTAEIHWLLDDDDIGTVNEDNKFILVNPDRDVTIQCLAITSTDERVFSTKVNAVVRRFLTHPSNAILGDSAEFHCSVYGPGVNSIAWKDSRGFLQESSTITQITHMELYATLTTQASDSYRCIASFDNSTELESGWVETLTYSVSLTDKFALSGRGFQATCKVDAKEPPVAIIWTLNAETMFEENDVFYDGYQGYSETSYYFASLSALEIAELRCTAIFGDNFQQITSPQKSLAPLGITQSPASKKMIKSSSESIDVFCEFYDYADVNAEVIWDSGSLLRLAEETHYVSGSITRSTLTLQTTDVGSYRVKCSVDYGKFGSVISNVAKIFVLLPPSIHTVRPNVGYGDVAEVTALIPKVTDNVMYHFSLNGVTSEGQCMGKNESYINSRLRWPLMLDTVVTLTVSHRDNVHTYTTVINTYGIEDSDIIGSLDLGMSADLRCTISNNPPPDETFWYIKSEKLLPTSVDESGTSALISILSLRDIKPSMYGLYACAAKYPNLPSVYQRVTVVPTGACLLPSLPNGSFPSAYISSGTSITPSCSGGFSLLAGYKNVSCRHGVLTGELPQCLVVEQSKDDVSLMMTLIVCACVVMTCFITLAFTYWFKTRSIMSKVGIIYFIRLIVSR